MKRRAVVRGDKGSNHTKLMGVETFADFIRDCFYMFFFICFLVRGEKGESSIINERKAA